VKTGPLFVTGTDTGVGKTTIARGLLRLGARLGQPVMPLKLIETGCTRLTDGSLDPADGRALAQAAERAGDLASIAPIRFALAAAPATAARAAGSPLDLRDLVSRVRLLCATGRVLLEGAGGLLVPITDRETMADLAAAVDATVLVIARDALGTINHTLLTLEALRGRGLRVAGVVLNGVSGERCDLGHRDTLTAFAGDVPIRGPIPWRPDADDDALADAVAAAGVDFEMLDARWR
jgi:dethiobiotin synthetase